MSRQERRVFTECLTSIQREIRDFPECSWFQLVHLPKNGGIVEREGKRELVSRQVIKTFSTDERGVYEAAMHLVWYASKRGYEDSYIRVNPIILPQGESRSTAARSEWMGPQIKTLIDIDPIKLEDGSTPKQRMISAQNLAHNIVELIETWCIDHEINYSPRLDFSGRGFQLILEHDPIESESAPQIRASIIGLLSFACSARAYDCDIDPSSADNARLKRMPTTFNTRTGLRAEIVAEGHGRLTQTQLFDFIKHLEDLTGLSSMELAVQFHERGYFSGLKSSNTATHDAYKQGSLRSLTTIDPSDYLIDDKYAPIVNEFRAIGIPRGRHHALRCGMAATLLSMDVSHDQIERIVWLSLNDPNDHAARKDAANSVKTTIRRIDRGQPVAGIGSLRKELGDSLWITVEPHFLSCFDFSKHELHFDVDAYLDDQPEPVVSSVDLDSLVIQTSTKIEQTELDKWVEKDIREALPELSSDDCDLLVQIALFCGVSTASLSRVFGSDRVADCDRNRASEISIRSKFWKFDRRGLIDRIVASTHVGIGAFRARIGLNRSCGIHHFAWSESATIEEFSKTEIDQPWARKIRRISRCGQFERSAVARGKTTSVNRMVCGDYGCVHCSSYVHDVAEWIKATDQWPEHVFVAVVGTTFAPSTFSIDNNKDFIGPGGSGPEDVKQAWMDWISEKEPCDITPTRMVKVRRHSRLPEFVAILHPEQDDIEAGFMVVSPYDFRGAWCVSREEALDMWCRRAMIRADRFRSAVERRDADALEHDPWLDTERFNQHRSRKTRSRESGFFFPGMERWKALKQVAIAPRAIIDGAVAEDPITWIYRHAPTGVEVLTIVGDPPVSEHEVYWAARSSQKYQDAMREHRRKNGGFARAQLIAEADAKAVRSRERSRQRRLAASNYPNPDP